MVAAYAASDVCAVGAVMFAAYAASDVALRAVVFAFGVTGNGNVKRETYQPYFP